MPGSLSILLVEKEAGVVENISSTLALSSLSANLFVATSLSQAQQFLTQQVVDTLLYGESIGLNLIEMLCQLQPTTPIVILSDSPVKDANGFLSGEKCLLAQEWLSVSDADPDSLSASIQRAINRKLAEVSLYETREKFSRRNLYPPDAFFTFDNFGTITTVNRAAEKLLEVPRNSLFGKTN